MITFGSGRGMGRHGGDRVLGGERNRDLGGDTVGIGCDHVRVRSGHVATRRG